MARKSDPIAAVPSADLALRSTDWAGSVHCSLRFFPLHTWAASEEQNIMAKIDLQTPVSSVRVCEGVATLIDNLLLCR